ncbi:MAG: TolC family protein [Gemmatimonadetes bacterium]|nr:TolC family protein [Gemmatimonadota bacterium]
MRRKNGGPHQGPQGKSERNTFPRLGHLRPSAVGLLAMLAVGVPLHASAQQTERSLPVSGPLTLSAAAEMAFARNRDIATARQQLNLAGEQVSEAWSNVYPRVDFSGTFTRNVAPQVSFLPAQIFDPNAPEGEFIPIQFGADNLWNLQISAEQPLFRAGVFVGVGAASRFRSLQSEALRGRSQEVITRVRVAFFDLLLAQEEVRLTENSVMRVRRSLDETKAMNRAGLTDDYDVLRLEVELANLEPNLRRAQNRQVAARRTLAVELDLDPATELEVAGNLAELDLAQPEKNSPANRDILAFVGVDAPTDEAVEALVSEAAARRTDVRQLELTEDLRMAELRVEQAEYLPEVTAFGTYGLAAQQNGSPDFFGTSMQRGSTKQIGLRVNVPLFIGFQRDARVDQRRAALRQAETETRIMRDQAVVQIRNLVDQVDEARARAEGQRLAVSQAMRGYEIASAQYREGLGTQLELTDAEVALRQSEFNYAQAVYDYLSGRASLDQATGRVPLIDQAAVQASTGGGR